MIWENEYGGVGNEEKEYEVPFILCDVYDHMYSCIA